MSSSTASTASARETATCWTCRWASFPAITTSRASTGTFWSLRASAPWKPRLRSNSCALYCRRKTSNSGGPHDHCHRREASRSDIEGKDGRRRRRRHHRGVLQGPEGHRSEEHTSELQSLMRISYDVFCLKKK